MKEDDDDPVNEQDNFDIERHELMRLMGTAKDDMRKAIIQESLNNLDSPERSHSKRIGQASPNMFETEKTGKSFSRSPPIRPVSARMRRPSMNNLDVIQEEKRLAVEKAMDAKEEYHISYIQLDDVYEFSTSSFDPKLSHWNPFTQSPKSNGNQWITTGLMPQFLSIDLKLCWLIVEIRVIGYGIEEITVSIEGSIHKMPMVKENRSTFTFSSSSVKESNPNHLNSMRLSPSRIFGDRLLLTLEKSSDIFCVVDRILIQAVPTGT